MYKRRKFLRDLSLGTAGLSLVSSCSSKNENGEKHAPVILSTWKNLEANSIAINHIKEPGSSLLDAIELGVNSVESNPDDTSVGYGGLPDRTGNVTLDACIMDHKGNAGSVTYLKNIMHPVSVARKVMDSTPHVILSGDGALDFATQNGFTPQDLLTEKSKEAYKKWLVKSDYKPRINVELHDTIGMIGVDHNSNLSGACSTSGLAFKMQGRVGDSPIIGSGLFVDNEFGCATATGLGELVIKSCSTFLVVELMRQGFSPMEACKKAINRIVSRYDCSENQVGLIALNKLGQHGAYAIQPGFMYTRSILSETTVNESDSYYG